MLWARLATCSILTLATAGYGQAAQTGSPKATETFATTSRNVLLDVVVTDNTGKPIHGLKAHDFTILENGVLSAR